ncbi:hypothetical protein B0H16DRAFT_1536780, partial [Mycena metata]
MSVWLILPSVSILFALAGAAHVGHGALEPCHAPENDGLQYNATYQVAICANQTLFTPATTELPEGTYIALGLKGTRELAEYLDVYPELKITNLLLSDSTVEDLAVDFGYKDSYIDFMDDLDYTRVDRETQLEYDAINKNISRDLQQTILDLDTLSSRIMDQVAPSLETLAFLNYITTPGEYYYPELTTHDNRTRNVLNRDFPRLTHLTLRDRRWQFQTLEGRSTFFPPLPALTHLHILTGRYVPAMSVVRQAMPNATHILFSANYAVEFSAKLMFLVKWAQSVMRILVGSAKSPTILVQPNHNPVFRRGMGCGNPGV